VAMTDPTNREANGITRGDWFRTNSSCTELV
jgi:hypothetical protein